MNYKVFLLTPILVALTIINPLQCITIKPQEFIDSLYKEHKWLEQDCSPHIKKTLKKFYRAEETITITKKMLKRSWKNVLSAIEKYGKNSNEHQAAFVINYKLKELYAQEKKIVHECSICLEKIDSQQTELTCSHIFCTPCIFSWFAQDKAEEGGNTKCPICRTSIAQNIQDSFKTDPKYAKILKENLQKKDAEDIDSFFGMMREDVQGMNVPQALGAMLRTLLYVAQNGQDSDPEDLDSEDLDDEPNSWTDDLNSDDDLDSEGSIDYPSSDSSSSDEE